jgi:hypothetical protein
MNISKGKREIITMDCSMTYDEFIDYYNNCLCMGSLNEDETITVNGLKYKIIDGEVQITRFDCNDKDNPLTSKEFMVQIVLPPFVSSINSGAFMSCENIVEISGDGVKCVDVDAFNACVRLQKVNFPNLTYIGHAAFCDCFSLTEIDLRNCEKIKSEAFYKCVALLELSAPKLTECCLAAFSNCYSLTKCNLDSVNYIADNAFLNCFRLKKVYAPKIILGLPYELDVMTTTFTVFSGCIELSELLVGTYVGTLEYFHRKFFNCTLLYDRYVKIQEKG